MKSRRDRRETENIMGLVMIHSYGLAQVYLEKYRYEHGKNRLYRQMYKIIEQAHIDKIKRVENESRKQCLWN